jgi:hypothetical protein
VITGGGGGGGGGGGKAADRADVDAATMANPKTIAVAVTDLRPAPHQSLARENHDEPRINAFPENRAPTRKNTKIPVGAADLPPVSPKRQSGVVPAHGRLPGVVVPLPQVQRGDLLAELIS